MVKRNAVMYLLAAGILVVLMTPLGSEVSAQTPDFLCKPAWRVGDIIASFAILVIRTATVGNIIFEYLRTEQLVWKGEVRLPQGLSVAGEAFVFKRLQLRPATQKRYRHGFSNLDRPPAQYDGVDFIDVYTGTYQYAATLRLRSGLPATWSDLSSAQRVGNMTTDGGPTWPLIPGSRTVKTFEFRDMTIEVRPEVVTLASMGALPALMVSDEVSYQGARWIRRAWWSARVPYPLRREWRWPSHDLSLELEEFRPASLGPPQPAEVEVPTIIPSIGPACVRAGFTDVRPEQPPQRGADTFRIGSAVHAYLVASVPVLREDVVVSPVVCLLKEAVEVDRWTSPPVRLHAGWDHFWFFRTYGPGRLEPGSYMVEWLIEGQRVATAPFAVSP